MHSFPRLLAAPRGAFALSIIWALACAVMPVRAQSPATESRATQVDAAEKTTVVVMPFEFAAPVPAQPRVAPRRPSIWPPMLGQPSGIGRAPDFARHLAHGPARERGGSPAAASTDGAGDAIGDAIGVGVADLLVARLLEVPGFRIVERRRLDLLLNEQQLAARDSLARRDTAGPRETTTMLRARYVITGSITRFGTEERRALGGLGGAFGLGALGFKRPKTQVTLTARVIDAASGEVLASVTGAGTSTKGGSVLIGGLGGGIGGGVALTSSEFRASALGEATERAIEQLANAIVAKRDRWE